MNEKEREKLLVQTRLKSKKLASSFVAECFILIPGALSPAALHSVAALQNAHHLQQLQAHLIRSASTSPFLSPQNSLQNSLLYSAAGSAAAAAAAAAAASGNPGAPSPYFPLFSGSTPNLAAVSDEVSPFVDSAVAILNFEKIPYSIYSRLFSEYFGKHQH